MAHLSPQRTGSLNSVLGTQFSVQTVGIKNGNLLATRTSSNHNFKPRNVKPLFRAETPVAHHASESHIHRIRVANTRGDFKRNLQNQLPVVILSKRPEFNESSESDSEDVESVRWTAPLDITTYLYKPQFIINPSAIPREDVFSGTSTEKEKDDLLMDETQHTASKSQSSLSLPTITDDPGCKPLSTESVQNYLKMNKRMEHCNNNYKSDVANCKTFVRELNNDMMEMSLETKRSESSRTKRKHGTREEIVRRGYDTMKRMYELNPNLTEAAAKRNICGPPGNHWMGLTRVEVLETLRRIRSEFEVPPDRYCSDTSRMNFSVAAVTVPTVTDKKSKKKDKLERRKTKKQTKKAATKERKPKQITRFKAPMLQMQHVPGPPHLHTNVCIRPWKPDLDGWNNTQEQREMKDNKPRQSIMSQTDNDGASRRFPCPKTTTTQNSMLKESHILPPADNVDEEGFITLEIFNPGFKLFR